MLYQTRIKTVYACYDYGLVTRKKFVVKAIKKEEYNDDDLPLIFKQVQKLKQVDHPSIVRVIETYND